MVERLRRYHLDKIGHTQRRTDGQTEKRFQYTPCIYTGYKKKIFNQTNIIWIATRTHTHAHTHTHTHSWHRVFRNKTVFIPHWTDVFSTHMGWTAKDNVNEAITRERKGAERDNILNCIWQPPKQGLSKGVTKYKRRLYFCFVGEMFSRIHPFTFKFAEFFIKLWPEVLFSS